MALGMTAIAKCGLNYGSRSEMSFASGDWMGCVPKGSIGD